MKSIERMVIVLACVYALLWVGGVVAYLLLGGPPEDAAWTAPVFLAVAAALALAVAPADERPRLLAGAAIGFAAEALGVARGFPFGAYHYTAVLYPRVLGVPLVMAAAWLVLFAYVRQMTRRPLLAAAWMTAIDLVIDPLAANALGYWRWARGGWYYGIPWTNFAGWFGVSLLIFGLVRRPAPPSRGLRALGASVVLFFTVLALGSGLWLAGAAGVASLAPHAAPAIRAARRCARNTGADRRG